MDKSTFEACSFSNAVPMTSLMVAPLPEDPSLPGSVALKPEESNPTQPNPLPPLHRSPRPYNAPPPSPRSPGGDLAAGTKSDLSMQSVLMPVAPYFLIMGMSPEGPPGLPPV